MGEAGHSVGPSESAVEKPLLASDDVGDFHQVVIHDVSQMVCGQLVGALP